jgi:hypothetical protein
MSKDSFIKYIDETQKLINDYVSKASSVISLLTPDAIGKVADNANQINISKANIDKEKNIFKLITHLDIVLKSILESIDAVKSENVIKEVLVGRSFTVVAEIKAVRDKIIEASSEIKNLYEKIINEFVNIGPATEEDKELIRKTPILLIRMADKMTDARSVKLINEIVDGMLKLSVVPTATAQICMRTWPRTGDEVDTDPTVEIVTGQNLKYNLQGLVSANWVAKHKLGESKTAGLSKVVIERCSTIEAFKKASPKHESPKEAFKKASPKDESPKHESPKHESPKDESSKEESPKHESPTDELSESAFFRETESNTPTITYGGSIYKLEYMPTILSRQITYAQILANAAFSNITLNPPIDEMDYRRDEAFKVDMMSRVKSNVAAAMRDWLRGKETFKFQTTRDIIKAVMKVCAIGIKNSLITSSTDVNKLLVNMAAITDSYKRVDSALTNNLNTRFGDIQADTLFNKIDFPEIMTSLADKSVDDINRQPSIFDLLL